MFVWTTFLYKYIQPHSIGVLIWPAMLKSEVKYIGNDINEGRHIDQKIYPEKSYTWLIHTYSYRRKELFTIHENLARSPCFLCCVLFVYVMCLVYPLLPVSLDCPLLIAPSVFSYVYLINDYWKQKLLFITSWAIKALDDEMMPTALYETDMLEWILRVLNHWYR